MMEQVHMQIQEGCDDKMGHYVHYIGGGIVDSKQLGMSRFAQSCQIGIRQASEEY